MKTIIPITKLELDGPATWDVVKYWAELAAKFQHASVAAQVMAGFGLLELRKQNGTNQGKRSDLCDTTSPHDAEKLNWPDLVQERAGISDDTARRWMLMAEGIKSRWKKLAPQARLKELMALPPSQWNEEDTKLVTDSLHKVCDGATQLEFMRELGLAKKATGNKDAKGNGSRKLTTEEQRAKAIELALEDSGCMGHAIAASNKNFFLLAAENDLEIDAQISVLEFALKLRHKYRNTPRPKRNDALVAEIEKLIQDESPLKV